MSAEKGDERMLPILDSLRQFTIQSVVLRLLLAVVSGGILGLNRAKKGRAAGFRTHMFVCMGAALTMLLSQYYTDMLAGPWSAAAAEARTDISRIGAQVISGIGFLGAGTILVTSRQEVKGLTTAAGLWASACMGLAIGAGFYECVILACLYMMVSIQILPWVEALIVEHSRNMNIYIEFHAIDDVGRIINHLKAQDVRIYGVEIGRDKDLPGRQPNALLSIRLNKSNDHEKFLAAIAALTCVTKIDEV